MRDAQKKLRILRLSLRRVAESTEDEALKSFIPKDGSENGWNYLCLRLCDYINHERGYIKALERNQRNRAGPEIRQ